MGPDFIVIGCVPSQHPTQMCFASDDDVIETLATDRSDQPFCQAILPG